MILDDVTQILVDVLNLGDTGATLDASSPLLGALPELDSMAVVNLMAALEEHFGFTIEDDDISARTFATLGSLSDFVAAKIG